MDQYSESLYIVIPAYNEEENVRDLIDDWYPVVERLPDARLLVIDDGSQDKTYDILYELRVGRPKLVFLSKPNGGHGDTLLFGYKYAVLQNATWIFQTDADGQTNADEFWGFWKKRDRYDAILGYRKKRGDGLDRKFVEDVLCFIIWIVFGIRIPDANCPFRLMRAEKVASYIQQMPKHYFLPNVMLTVFFVYNRNRVLFKNITFANRKRGSGSINLRKIVKVGLKSVGDFIHFRKNMMRQHIEGKN